MQSLYIVILLAEVLFYLCDYMEQKTVAKSNPAYDCVIIGGGISGVSFAYQLSRQGKKVRILEKERRIGGQIQTYASATHPDFWTELGAHTCYNSYAHFLSVVQEAGLQGACLPLGKARYLLYTNRGKAESVGSHLSYAPLVSGCFKMLFASRQGKSVRQFFRPVVGASNYDRVFSHMFRAVICQDADDYPAELFLKKRDGRIQTFPRKYSFQKGLSSFLHAVVGKENLPVQTATEVLRVDWKDGVYAVYTSSEVLLARDIAIATDPQTASVLLKDLEPSISRLLQSIPIFQSEAMSVIVDKDKVDIRMLAGMIPQSDDFMSVVSRDVVEHPDVRGFTFHFFANRKTEGEKLRLVSHVLGIGENDILEYAFALHRLPSMRVEHTGIVRQISELRTHPHLFVLGNYLYGLSIEDCVYRSYEEFKRFMSLL